MSGTHDPSPLSALPGRAARAVTSELLDAARLLEREHGDVQDIEFTVERGRLYLLQTRSAKRSPLAAVRTAVDFASEGQIDRAEALRRISAEQLASVLAPRLHESVTSAAEVLARGTPACPGVAAGHRGGGLRRGRGGRGRRGARPPHHQPRGRAGHDRRARRGDRARRRHLARRGGHARARAARAWSAWATG